jgi:hypothetical protein
MIILTAAQAAQVRGISPIDAGAALEPVALRDGTFYLPDEVIDDPAHADVKALLQACPKGAVVKANTYSSTQPGDTRAAARTKIAADAAALAARGIPSFRSATRTDPRPKPPVVAVDTNALMQKAAADEIAAQAAEASRPSPVDNEVLPAEGAAIEEAQPKGTP